MSVAMKNIDVFILCGGLGKRLGAMSHNIPKPMIKIDERPFLDIIIDYMADFGFRRFILGTGYKADTISDYYRKNKMSGLDILFSQEKTPLDTGGAIRNAKRLIRSNPFLVLNGDSFCEFDPLEFLNFHKQKKPLISVLLKRVFNGNEYGEVKIDRSSRILSFKEKDNGNAKRCLINSGVYIFDNEVFSLMPSVSRFSLERDLFPRMAKKRIFGHPYSGFFIDIGTPDRYLKARRYFQGKSIR